MRTRNDETTEVARTIQQVFQICLDRFSGRKKQVAKLWPYILVPIVQKLALTGVGGTAEQGRFRPTLSPSVTNAWDLPKQFGFNWFDFRELDRVLFQSANQHFTLLSPTLPATNSRGAAGHKTPLVPACRSKRSIDPYNGPPAYAAAPFP